MLTLATLPAAGECYLPANGSGSAMVTITTSADYADGVVTLAGTGGTFIPATVDVEAAPGQQASAISYFSYTPSSTSGPAVADISASSEWSESGLYPILIAGAPRMTASTALNTGSHAVVYVDTRGRLAACYAELFESDPGDAGALFGAGTWDGGAAGRPSAWARATCASPSSPRSRASAVDRWEQGHARGT